YATNTKYPLSPFPNFWLLQKDLKEYEKLGITKVFMESNRQMAGEFQELRSYLLAQLLWNPNINLDSVIADFLNAYYGEGGDYIKKYITETTQELNSSNRVLLRTANPNIYSGNYLSLENLNKYEQYFEEARKAVIDNSTYLERVNRAELPIKFAKLQV